VSDYSSNHNTLAVLVICVIGISFSVIKCLYIILYLFGFLVFMFNSTISLLLLINLLGGVFKLELFLPEEYPMAAPKVTTKFS